MLFRSNMVDGLKIGQLIMIPLTDNNFSQDGKYEKDEVLVPVYYKNTSRQAFYQIGQRFNNVPSALLKKWNRLSEDQAAEGASIIIGYLKVKADLSPLASTKSTIQEDPSRFPERADKVVSTSPEKSFKPTQPEKKEASASSKENPGGFFRSQFEKQQDRKSTRLNSSHSSVSRMPSSA